jgi:hypothetical protein
VGFFVMFCDMLAEEQRCEVTDAVRLHVKLLSFSWDHELRVLRGGPLSAILALRLQSLDGVACKLLFWLCSEI